MKRRQFLTTVCATGLAAASIRTVTAAELFDNDEKIVIPKQNIPYQPVRPNLYTFSELFAGFDVSDPTSWERTLDFSIYRHFHKEGCDSSDNPHTGMYAEKFITSGFAKTSGRFTLTCFR